MNKLILNPSTTCITSIDNSRTFADKTLNELYVTGGEIVAVNSKKLLDETKRFKVRTINILEKHPKGHISFASSYKNKIPGKSTITLEEVINRTDENHGLSEKAAFSVSDLKAHLSTARNNEQFLRPEHSKDGEKSVELMHPLSHDDFEKTIIKGYEAHKEAYSGFEGTTLDDTLQERNIENHILVGLAEDYCVGLTGIHSRTIVKKPYNTYIVSDAVAGVSPETTEQMRNELRKAGVEMISIQEIIDALSAYSHI